MLTYRTSFVSFAVEDLAAAKTFYEEVLGLSVTEEMGLLSLHLGSGLDVMVYPKPDFTPATYTVLNFKVDDLEASVDELVGAGVTFERYEGLTADDRGIHRGDGPDIAWFTDPAGNILSVLHEV
ncbi:MAG TPA: VOC family protein [Acidothermaceae bacterium]|jgi:predicted enzyme related to lactoylglutathione lyase